MSLQSIENLTRCELVHAIIGAVGGGKLVGVCAGFATVLHKPWQLKSIIPQGKLQSAADQENRTQMALKTRHDKRQARPFGNHSAIRLTLTAAMPPYAKAQTESVVAGPRPAQQSCGSVGPKLADETLPRPAVVGLSRTPIGHSRCWR